MICSNLRPFFFTALCTERDFDYRWTRHIFWCISKANL